MGADLSELDRVAISVSGPFARHPCVVVLGVGIDGIKHSLVLRGRHRQRQDGQGPRGRLSESAEIIPSLYKSCLGQNSWLGERETPGQWGASEAP